LLLVNSELGRQYFIYCREQLRWLLYLPVINEPTFTRGVGF
jgi:hypothetical protein